MLKTIDDFLDINNVIDSLKDKNIFNETKHIEYFRYDHITIKIYLTDLHIMDCPYFEMCTYDDKGNIKYYVHSLVGEGLWITEYKPNNTEKLTHLNKKDFNNPLRASITIMESGLSEIAATIVSNLLFAMEMVYGGKDV